MKELPLGKATDYVSVYTPSLLCPIARSVGRETLGIVETALPFKGLDIWNVYELSWLSLKGKPVVALAEIQVPADSPCMVESKSLKLYLNSFSQTVFHDRSDVLRTIESDLAVLVRAPVFVRITFPNEINNLQNRAGLPGVCLDTLDIEVDAYDVNPQLLSLEGRQRRVTETVYSHLLRSNCPVTQQPDWGTVVVEYTGNKMDHSALLKYIVSYRHHNGFHEQCVEQMFMDIRQQCAPEQLTVYARYTRRGGIDINPYRSSHQIQPVNLFTFRQ